MIDALRRADPVVCAPGQHRDERGQFPADGPQGPRDLKGRAGGNGTRDPAGHSGLQSALRRRLWLVVCCLALAALAFVDRPGNIIADTKLDLAVNPLGFLERALHLWDPAQFGQLQDQASGYLFPMGPFFVAGKLIALQPWIVQRLWITAVAVAAFLGMVRLCARLGVGTPGTQIAAGFAYALAPRGLTLLGVLSGELLPAAMLPWILLPLVRAVQQGPTLGTAGRIRAAAQSAVAVALCSGNNAASIVAMLIAAATYLLTAPRSARVWRVVIWWAPAVLLSTTWWLYPLFLLGKYGVSFLPYTESAAVTTSVTSLSNTFRGTEDWVSYLAVNGSPWWPVGFVLATAAVPTILTGLVAGLGLAGLLRRGLPARRYLLCVLILGVVIISSGYVSGLGNPLAGTVDHLLNGPLAPMRNLRKFDPLIRLPVAIGLAHLLATVSTPARRKAASLVAGVAIAVLALPAVFGGLSTTGDFPTIPAYWLHAVGWLNKHAGNQAVLAVPGARFGEYIWGRPMDDVLEALYKGDWASMQLGAVGSVGNVRLLDAIDQDLAAGAGSAGIAQVLGRMGIKYVLVRNDLIRSDLRGAWPARIHQALAESAGLVKVAQFGTWPVGSFTPNNAVSSFDAPYPAVEIYQVRGAQPVVTVQSAVGTPRVYGGPEALLPMASAGLLPRGPVLLNSDGAGLPGGPAVVTDSLRRRLRNFGEIRVDYSPTLTRSDPASTFAAATNYIEPGWYRYQSVARYYGIRNVTASSSAADIGALSGQSATGRLPFAAVDGDLRTMWESGALTGPVGQWIQINFEKPANPSILGVAFADDPAIGPAVTQVAISSAAGTVTDPVTVSGRVQGLQAPVGWTSWLRIMITGTKWKGVPGTQVGIAAISIPYIGASRTIVAPDVTLPHGRNPSAFVLSKAEPGWPGCVRTSMRWVCSPLLAKPTEEQYGFDHSFSAARPAWVNLTGRAILIDNSLIERYAWIGASQPRLTSSSAYTTDPQDQAQSAFDGDPATAWVAGGTDRKPTLRIQWNKVRKIGRVTISRPPGAAGPVLVQVTGAGGQIRSGWLSGATATLRFLPMRTNTMVLTFTPTTLPLQVSDVSIPGVRHLASAGALPFRLRCGLGPWIQLNGKIVPTRVSGSFRALLAGRPMRFMACRKGRLATGTNRVIEPLWDGFDVQAVVVSQVGASRLLHTAAAVTEPASVLRWGPARRVVRVWTDTASYLTVDQNFNPGWQAAIAGHVLRPVRLDGWRQGWLVPAGTAGLVTLSYLPDAGYRVSLLCGLSGLGLVMLIAFLPLRRRRRAIDPAEGVGEGAPLDTPGRWRGALATAATLARPISAALALLGCGLWVAGYPGLIILPALAVAFVGAIYFRGGRLARWLASSWLVTGSLLAAAGFGVLDHYLAQDLQSGVVVTACLDASQVLCLAVLARLFAGLIMGDRGAAGEPDS